MNDTADPEIATLAAVCTSLSALSSDNARQRVLDFAYAKFNLIVGRSSPSTDRPAFNAQEADDADAAFFAKFEHSKPAANVALLIARHYSKYGLQPFSTTEIKDSADAAGIVVPARIDMTLNEGGRKGKRFYQKLGGGKYRVTVHGEAFLRATYGVRKGSVSRRDAELASD
jgi:hypothetical protein